MGVVEILRSAYSPECAVASSTQGLAQRTLLKPEFASIRLQRSVFTSRLVCWDIESSIIPQGKRMSENETPQAPQKIILIVTDPDNPKQGEVMVIDEPRKAESAIEGLLEAGCDQQHIRTFIGTPFEAIITHRPVVTLVGSEMSQDESDARPRETRMSDAFPSAADDAG